MEEIESRDELRSMWPDDVGKRLTSAMESSVYQYITKKNQYGNAKKNAEGLCRNQVGYTSFAAQISALMVD